MAKGILGTLSLFPERKAYGKHEWLRSFSSTVGKGSRGQVRPGPQRQLSDPCLGLALG